jgi:Beta-lactamase enzyme family
MRGLRAVLACLAVALGGAAAGSAASPAMIELSPRSGEAFFGVVRAVGPKEATRAELRIRGGRRRLATVVGGRVVFRLSPGRYNLAVRFFARGRLLARARSERLWALPNAAQKAVKERRRDVRLSAALGSLGTAFNGYSAFFVHRLRTGEVAGWNADASFPAASLVKLALLVAALDRYGAEPSDPRVAREIRDLAVWSSNLASNRLLLRLGGSERAGSELVTRVLRRLGAGSSTFSGFYRLGTSVVSDTPRAPPFLTYRRTTAHDMGRVLFQLHAAALGRRDALARTRLSRREARVALGLLLSSDPTGDNLGLFRPVLPRVPMAQKQGWTTTVRHTAAIVYGSRGPTILVVLTYRHRLSLAHARDLARRAVRLTLL